MNPEFFERLDDCFAAASRLEGAERRRFVELIADDEMRRELEALLAAHDAAGAGFMARSAVEANAEALAGETVSEEMSGRRIGSFEIVREIGRGGMGAVYLARRADGDFEQRVALKLIKRGMDTDFIVGRFRAERRIMSRLEHPFIARLIDGGATDDGLPYFVMEYVEGKNLREFCAQAGASREARLAVFRKVCEAVAHAHRNLVVHRDLKPSNILVTPDGTPKLLDFGIAKALAGEDGEERTTTGFRLLTPKYAAPEQVRGEPSGTAADVFSLGVILGEMIGDGAARELRTIAARATRDEPAERYASVADLADDVRRFEEKRPILAQPESIAYRARKFVARHRFGVAAAALVAVIALAGLGAFAWQYREARIERARAEQRFNDVRSLAHAVIFDLHDQIADLAGSTKARKLLIEKALGYLEGIEPDAVGDPALQDEIAMAYLKIADVEGQVFEASMLETDKAVVHYRRALSLAESALAAEPSNRQFRADLATIRSRFAESLRGTNDLTESTELQRLAAADFDVLVGADDSDPEQRRKRVVAHLSYADTLLESGSVAATLPLYDEVLKMSADEVARTPGDLRVNRLDSVVVGRRAIALFRNGSAVGALAEIRRAEEISRRLSEANPRDAVTYRNWAVNCEDVSRMAVAAGDLAAAEEFSNKEVAAMSRLLKEDPENAQASYDVASAYNTLAAVLERAGRWREAFDARKKSLIYIAPLEKSEDSPELYVADFFELRARASLAAAENGDRAGALQLAENAGKAGFEIEKTSVETRNLYADGYVALGDAYARLGRPDDARRAYEKAVGTWEKLRAEGKLYPFMEPSVTAALGRLRR